MGRKLADSFVQDLLHLKSFCHIASLEIMAARTFAWYQESCGWRPSICLSP